MPSRYKMPEQKVLLTSIFLYLILSMLKKTLTFRRTLIYVCTRDLSRRVKDSILIHPVSYGNSEAPVLHDWFTLRKSSFPFSLIPTVCHYLQILLFLWWVVYFSPSTGIFPKLPMLLIPPHTYTNANLKS